MADGRGHKLVAEVAVTLVGNERGQWKNICQVRVRLYDFKVFEQHVFDGNVVLVTSPHPSSLHRSLHSKLPSRYLFSKGIIILTKKCVYCIYIIMLNYVGLVQ